MAPRVALVYIVVSLVMACTLSAPASPIAGGDGGTRSFGPHSDIEASLSVVSVTHPRSVDPRDYSDVLVLINNNSLISRQVGEYFASARGIQGQHVAYLDVPEREVISKDQFEDLRSQVKDHMIANQLVSSIDYIVTTKGFPLKITNSSGYYRACVDEELALIFGGQEGQIGNFFYVDNPYYGDREYFSRERQGIFLVNRLTGYDWSDVKGLIDRANDTIGNRGLFVLDVAPGRDGDPGYKIGNDWLRNANDVLTSKGEDVLFDETRWFVNYQDDVMGYCSWGSNDGDSTDHAKPHNSWVNGSIAETYVSTGARTFTYPPYYGQSMVADLIRENVTGVKGYVYEPFLTAVAHPDILFERYTAGFNLAESYRMASVMLGWMGVVVGDPKCAPYRDLPDLHVDEALTEITNTTPTTDVPVVLTAGVKNYGGTFENVSVRLYVNDTMVLEDAITFQGYSLTTLRLDLGLIDQPGNYSILLALNEEGDFLDETMLDNNFHMVEIRVMRRPVVSLSASSTEVLTLEDVSLTATALFEPRPIVRYYLVPGDGSPVVSSTNGTFLHRFEQDGTYNLTSYAIDEAGVLSLRTTFVVHVLNRPPTAALGIDRSEVMTLETIRLDAGSSSDLDGEVVSVEWKLGDGNGSTEWALDHTYERAGEYKVSLIVWDDDGAYDFESRWVQVLNRAPLPGFALQGDVIYKGVPVNFDASASLDPDGVITQYEWTFDDGSGGVVTRSPEVTHAFLRAGTVEVMLTAVDDSGSASSVSHVFEVLNRAPTASVLADAAEVPTGTMVTFDGSASADVDGRVVSFEFAIVGPDGTPSTVQSGTVPTMTYRFDNDGTYTVVLTVRDDDDDEALASVEVTVLNRPPVLLLDEGTALLEGSVINAPSTVPFGLDAHDPDGIVVSVLWYREGTGALLGEGARLDVDLDFEGALVVRVVATDDDDATATAWLNATVNLPPRAAFSFLHAADGGREGRFLPRDVIAFDAGNSSDPGGITAYQWDMGDGTILTGMGVEHAYAVAGTYTVTLIVTDAHGATDETTLVVVIEPRPAGEEPILSSGMLVALIAMVAVVAVLAAFAMLSRRREPDGG